MSLLSDTAITALSSWAKLGMTDTVTIERPTMGDSAYGDDETITYAAIGTAIAWFRSTPTAVAVSDTGALITANTYRLLVPLDTDIKPKDQVKIGDDTYIVTDTNVESTWKVYLTASLRRRE